MKENWQNMLVSHHGDKEYPIGIVGYVTHIMHRLENGESFKAVWATLSSPDDSFSENPELIKRAFKFIENHASEFEINIG